MIAGFRIGNPFGYPSFEPDESTDQIVATAFNFADTFIFSLIGLIVNFLKQVFGRQ